MSNFYFELKKHRSINPDLTMEDFHEAGETCEFYIESLAFFVANVDPSRFEGVNQDDLHNHFKNIGQLIAKFSSVSCGLFYEVEGRRKKLEKIFLKLKNTRFNVDLEKILKGLEEKEE